MYNSKLKYFKEFFMFHIKKLKKFKHFLLPFKILKKCFE